MFILHSVCLYFIFFSWWFGGGLVGGTGSCGEFSCLITVLLRLPPLLLSFFDKIRESKERSYSSCNACVRSVGECC